MWASFMELLMSGLQYGVAMSSLPSLAQTVSVNISHPKRHASKHPNQVTPYVRWCQWTPELGNTTCRLPLLSSTPEWMDWTVWGNGHKSPCGKLVLEVPDTRPQTCASRLAPAHLPALLLHHRHTIPLELSLLHCFPLGQREERLIGTARNGTILRDWYEMYWYVIMCDF